MVRAAGFEPAAPPAEAIEDERGKGSGHPPGAQIGAQISVPACPDLARVVAEWEHIAAPLKQAVLAIVAASEAGRRAP
jgi:hypothetical protein